MKKYEENNIDNPFTREKRCIILCRQSIISEKQKKEKRDNKKKKPH